MAYKSCHVKLQRRFEILVLWLFCFNGDVFLNFLLFSLQVPLFTFHLVELLPVALNDHFDSGGGEPLAKSQLIYFRLDTQIIFLHVNVVFLALETVLNRLADLLLVEAAGKVDLLED